MLVGCMLRDILSVAQEFQAVLAGQIRDELLISIRVRAAQLVIEMNHG